MHHLVLILASLLAGDVREYLRPLNAKGIDQAVLDAESYGEKKKIKREENGLHITLAPGDTETGWKTPQSVRVGGDFTITATFLVRKLAKPAQDDGVAVGVAIASNNLDQPDATLIRLIEPSGAGVYRSIDKGGVMPQMGMQMQPGIVVMPGQPGGQAVKPPRKTFPAKGETFILEFRREGPNVSYFVLDGESASPRYLGQIPLGSNDLAGVKLFALNRNGAEAVDVVFQSLTVRADRITGLGTEVRSVFGGHFHGDPTTIEDGKLVIGGTPKTPPATTAPPVTPISPAQAVPPGAAQPVAVQAVVVAPAAAPPLAVVIAPAAGPQLQGVIVTPPAAQANPAAAPANPAVAAAQPKVEPKARIPLDEVEAIDFERAVVLSGQLVGQPNLDFTMPVVVDAKDANAKPVAPKIDDVLAPPPGTAAAVKIPKRDPKPNGIRDLHLTLSNLRSAGIKQVMVSSQTDKGQTSWRLDTSDSNDWPLVMHRAGNETWGDLFLEPPPGDLKGKDLTVNITYDDGQAGNATIKADKSTDSKLAFDPKAPAATFDARVYLTGGDQLFGKFEGLDSDSLRLRTPWGDPLVVPLVHVAGLYMGLPDHKESSESFARRLRKRAVEDLLLARSNDGEIVAISGVAEATEGDKLRFHFQEKSRTLPLKQVEGLVLATRPEPDRPPGIRPTFSMTGGLVVSGLWKSIEATTWKVETAWGSQLKLPATEILRVRFHGGQMTYLSDLEPSKVEETPFFSRRNPWHRDVNLAGLPLRMNGQTFERGLSVHSRSALTYDLNARYVTFEALVGFDESVKGIGRVDCRVFADDKQIFANLDLRADAPPVKLALPVAGVQKLKLLVDFGRNQDTGDRLIWANARLFRKQPPVEGKPAGPANTLPAESRTSKPGSGR